MKLTPDQFKARYGFLPPVTPTSSSSSEPEKPGFLRDLGTDIKQTVSDVSKNVSDAEEGVHASMKDAAEGKISKAKAFFQSLGIGLGAASSGAGNVVKGLIKSVLPQGAEDAVKEKTGAALAPVLEVSGIKTLIENYQALADDPSEEAQRTKRDIDSILGLGQFALEAVGAKGAGEGAARGVQGVDDAARAGGNALEEAATSVGEEVSKVAKNAAGKVEDLVAKPLSKPYETALKETPADLFDEYADVARKSSLDYRNPTPLETAGKKAQDALDTIKRKADAIGREKGAVIEQASVGNKPVGNIVVRFRQNLKNYLGTKTAVEGDSKMITEIMSEAEKLGANPSAKQVDQFIDFAQDRIYTGGRDLTIPVTDSTTGSLRRFVGELNESLKVQLPTSYRNLNSRYSQIIDTLNELNVKLGKEGERGGALMKRVFSPSDARTKELFEEVKKLTGIDLTNEATLARFVMEAMGDSRQASLLQQLQIPSLSPQGALDFLLDKATSKFNTPEAILRRARELTIQ